MKKFAIIECTKVINFSNAVDVKSFARIRLSRELRVEGYNRTNKGLMSYLNDWVDTLRDLEDDETITIDTISDFVSSHLTYTNIHLQKYVGGNCIPISSDEKTEFCNEICRLIDSVVEKSKNVIV